MRRIEWLLGSTAGAAVVVIFAGVAYYGISSGNDGSGRSSGVSVVQTASSTSAAGSGATKHNGDFTLTNVPDAFHANKPEIRVPKHADGKAQQSRSATHTEQLSDGSISRSVHYNNVPAGESPSSVPKLEAFVVATATGTTAADLRERKRNTTRDRWTTVNGRKGLLEPANAEHALNTVLWNVGDVGITVSGRGMTMKQVLRIAKGVRLS